MSLHQARTELLAPARAIHSQQVHSCQLNRAKKTQSLPRAPHKVELHHAFNNNFGVLSMAQLRSNRTPPLKGISHSRMTNSQIRSIKDRSLQHRINGLTQDKVFEELEARKQLVESRAWQRYLNESLHHAPLFKPAPVFAPPRQAQSVQPGESPLKEKSSIRYINNFVKTRYRRVRPPFHPQADKSSDVPRWMEPWEKETEGMAWPLDPM